MRKFMSTKRNWKPAAMMVVLSAVVYQGLLAGIRFENHQKIQKWTVTSEGPKESRTWSRGNAAPLYAAAASLQQHSLSNRSRRTSLAEYRSERASLDETLLRQRPAFEALRQATLQPRCKFSKSELEGDFDYLGLRSLVMTSCVEMMRLADLGQHREACEVARDIIGLCKNMGSSPTAIFQTVSLYYSNQVLLTVNELHSAYPNGGYQTLDADLESLAEALEKGLSDCPAFERLVLMDQFEETLVQAWQDNLTGRLLSPLDLPVELLKLSYINRSEKAEDALKSGDQDQMMEALEKLKPELESKFTLAPDWSVIAKRTFDTTTELRSAF